MSKGARRSPAGRKLTVVGGGRNRACGESKRRKAPKITEDTVLRMYVVAGGRCSFAGCNEYLLDEPLTKREARLANIAHIVAASEDGPRGRDPLPMERRSDSGNLMLLCPLHHGFIDKKKLETVYPSPLLRSFKKSHEDHIRKMTGTKLKEKTTALRMVGQIRGHLVSVPDVDIRTAVFAHEGRHVEEIIDIEIGAIPDGADVSYLSTARRKIGVELRRRVLPQIEAGTMHRLSVFALARIPLLCEIGYGIGDKVPMALYQHHRAPVEGWTWPSGGRRIGFEIVDHVRDHGGDEGRVAILLAVSGGDLAKARRATRAKHLYELRPKGYEPTRTLVSSAGTLDEFRSTYHQLLSRIEKEHPMATRLDVFPAVPAPVAVIIGRDIGRDVVPDATLYDLVDGEYVAASALKTKTPIALGVTDRSMIVEPGTA